MEWRHGRRAQVWHENLVFPWDEVSVGQPVSVCCHLLKRLSSSRGELPGVSYQVLEKARERPGWEITGGGDPFPGVGCR